MKKILSFVVAALFAQVSFAQVSTVPATNIVPTDSLKIIVDLNALDQSLEHVQNLVADADAGLDMYVWTWKPFEFAAGHPKVNGLGGSPWKNSNPILKMTKEGPRLYSWSIVPTEFYEVDAATVYQNDIEFLVKPLDGGGYGSPDRKSTDLKIKVDPPSTNRDPIWHFPKFAAEDDIITIVYENGRETKPSMQNLDATGAYVFVECKMIDGTIVRYPTNYITADMSQFPESQMTFVGDQTFNWLFVPRDYLNLAETDEIDEIKLVIRKAVFASGAERVKDDLIVIIKCP